MKKQINRMTIGVALISSGVIGLSSTSLAQTTIMDQIGPDDGSGVGSVILMCQHFEAVYAVYDIATLDNFASSVGTIVNRVEMVLSGWNGFADPSYVQGYTANLHSSPYAAAIDLMGDIDSSYADAADITMSGTWTGVGYLISMPAQMTCGNGVNWISMIPRNPFNVNGQTGVLESNIGDGVNAWHANPGGGFGFSGNLQGISSDVAYRIRKACEPNLDCNKNGIDDCDDIFDGTSEDCNFNNIPDECDIDDQTSYDCDQNGVPDECQPDCDGDGWIDPCDNEGDCDDDGIPDNCETDCQPNGVPDDCDIIFGISEDCNEDGVPDECELADDPSLDCDGNGVPDSCDLADDPSLDCDGDGVFDSCAINDGLVEDCNGNNIPDSCDLADGTEQDCNGNGVPDSCEVNREDCNANGIPDECDIDDGTSNDVNENGIPDECEVDCNGNGVPDHWDIITGTSENCNANGIPDECDIDDGTSTDWNENGIPDECEVDCNTNGYPDDYDIKMGWSDDVNGDGIPDECQQCIADITGDNMVDVKDLLAIIGYWGSDGPLGDINEDGIVDVIDMLIVIGNWGPCE